MAEVVALEPVALGKQRVERLPWRLAGAVVTTRAADERLRGVFKMT